MKKKFTKIAVAIAVIGIAMNVTAQPVNNSCFNAAVLTVNAPCTAGTNASATLDGPATTDCWTSAPDRDVWYTFTTGAAGTYTITTDNGSANNTQVKIFSGACGALTLVACNDNVGANGLNINTSVASASLAASTTYLVQVDIAGFTQASFCIALRYASNDNCTNAQPLSINGGCTVGSNYGATVQAGEDVTATACPSSNNNATVWYSFTTGPAATYTISTNNGAPNTDTQIKIYSAPCGTPLQLVACNEDGGAAPNTLAAIATASLAAATTYYVQVDLFANEIGSFCLSVSYLVNDNCLNAIPLTVNTGCTNGNNFGATVEIGENVAQGCWAIGEAAPFTDHTVWYTFTTGGAGTYTISTDNGGSFDSQLKLYTACGSLVDVACDDDGGIMNDFASVICATLSASTTYYIQVDGFNTGTGGAMGTFCISVNTINTVPNDCINNAMDITSLIVPVNNSTNPFDCNYNFLYATAGSCGSTTVQQVIGDPNLCNGSSTPLVYTPYPDHYDIWFKFTVTPALPPTYLHLFPLNANAPFLAMGLYGETTPGIPPTSICPGGNISGLTFIDCSSPDVIYAPPPPDPVQGQDGGARDEGACSTPIHARIDISGLANGTYYIRVWEYSGIEVPPTPGYFNLCAESAVPVGAATDACPGGNIGYTGPDYNVDVSSTFLAQSNAGMHGNACNTDPNEPQLSAAPAGDARVGCAGPWTTYIGAINNVINNTAIYSFTVNSCPTDPACRPTVMMRLSNIIRDGTPGNVAQVQVLAPGYCNNSANPQTIMNGVANVSCLEMRPPANATLPNGTYSLVVDGQDGQLLQFDLFLSINYPCAMNMTSTGDTCFVISLPVELLSFNGVMVNGVVQLSWETALEINNDYFELERSVNGINFTKFREIDGAGNSNSVNHYITYDSEPLNGITYYRIRQVDFDGTFNYSDKISISNNYISNGVMAAYVNADGNLNVQYFSEGKQNVMLRMMNVAGEIIMQQTMNMAEGQNRFLVHSGFLNHGMYFLQVVDNSKSTHQCKFIR